MRVAFRRLIASALRRLTARAWRRRCLSRALLLLTRCQLLPLLYLPQRHLLGLLTMLLLERVLSGRRCRRLVMFGLLLRLEPLPFGILLSRETLLLLQLLTLEHGVGLRRGRGLEPLRQLVRVSRAASRRCRGRTRHRGHALGRRMRIGGRPRRRILADDSAAARTRWARR